MTSLAAWVVRARKEIAKRGVLLMADATHPSLTLLIAGEPIKGSWWGHRDGKMIFNVGNELDEDLGVLCVPLVAGKLTFLDRRLFPAFFAVATEAAAWQQAGLSTEAKALLAALRKKGELCATPETRTAVKELETRLLALSRSVHTETGAHQKALAPWSVVAAERGVDLDDLPEAEAARATLAAASPAGARMPWHKRRARA